MTVALDHTIVAARDAKASARFLTRILGLGEPARMYHFEVVELGNGVSLDFVDAEGGVRPQHYAFLVGEDDFDATFGRIVERDLDYYADPGGRQHGEINTDDGGRGLYWEEPSGHLLEIITRPYGSGG